MKQNCQHCGELIVGDAYWVTSEHEGIPLLDLIVCSLCSMEAKKAWAPYGGNQCQEQTSFSSKPTESPHRSRHLIKHRQISCDSAERPMMIPMFGRFHRTSRLKVSLEIFPSLQRSFQSILSPHRKS